MSETSALMDTLRQEGISPDLLRAVEEYRTAHPLAEALRPRIPSPCLRLLRQRGVGAGAGRPALRRKSAAGGRQGHRQERAGRKPRRRLRKMCIRDSC